MPGGAVLAALGLLLCLPPRPLGPGWASVPPPPRPVGPLGGGPGALVPLVVVGGLAVPRARRPWLVRWCRPCPWPWVWGAAPAALLSDMRLCSLPIAGPGGRQ